MPAAPLSMSCAGVVAIGAYGALALFQPRGVSVVPPCPLHVVTGLDCPLCGATRATRSLLLDMNVPAAIDHNAFYVLVLLPLVVVFAALWLVGRRPVLRTRAVTVLGALALVFAVARNLPIAPFRYLNA